MPIYKFEDFMSEIVETEDIQDQSKRNISNVFCPSTIDIARELLSVDFLKYIQTGTPKNGAEFLKIALEYFDQVLEIKSMPEMLNIVYYLGSNMEKFSKIVISYHFELEEGKPIEEIEQELNEILTRIEEHRKSKGKEKKESSIEEIINKLKGEDGIEVHRTEMKLDGNDPMAQMLMMILMDKMMKGKDKNKEEEDNDDDDK